MTKMLVVALSVAALASGCSIALQEKPLESTFGYAKQGCSTSSKYWIADAVIAGVAGATTIGGRLYGDSSPENESTAYTIAGLTGVLAIAYLASAGNGRRWVDACHVQTASWTASR